jgi:hypothetical protein
MRSINSDARSRNVLGLLAIVISALLAAPCALSAYGSGAVQTGGTKVTFGVNPTSFQVGGSVVAEFTVSSVYMSPLTLSPGTVFRFVVDSSFGMVTGVSNPISVNSATLLAGDFSASFSTSQVTLTYNGSAKSFSYGDTLSVKVALTASMQPGAGKVSLSSQFVSIVNGALPFTTVSIVDFANSGTSSVSHDGSLMGNGTPASPLGINMVGHDTTLTGNGTAGSPLSLAIPMKLNGDGSELFVLEAKGLSNPVPNGSILSGGIRAMGASGAGDGQNSNFAGRGILAVGGDMTGLHSSSGRGIEAAAGNASNGAVAGEAGLFQGDVQITGNLKVDGGMKMFHIDHPLDPANKYLNHAAIESSEVLNVYSGNVTTDDTGHAVVKLPDWFEALNKDFRYQLTVLGTFAQAIIAEEISNNRFSIRTSASNIKVSWQVTGVRHDNSTKKWPLAVEEAKSEHERGYFLNPDVYGQPEEKGMEWAHNPQLMEELKQHRLDVERARKSQSPQQ